MEVEDVLYNHPAVLETAAITIPHEESGEVTHAYVVLKQGNEVTEKELLQFAKRKLSPKKVITSVSFLEEIPKTASGKILKVELRRAYLESIGKLEQFEM